MRIASSGVISAAQPLVDLLPHLGDVRPVLADALQQANDERQARGMATGLWAVARRLVQLRQIGVGANAFVPTAANALASPATWAMSAALSTLGQAHSSPMVNGDTD